jgi:membrane dipeptidase
MSTAALTAKDKAALDLHQRMVVVDAHEDILMDVLRRRQSGETRVLNNVWAPRLKKGGIDVETFAIFIDSQYLPENALRRTLLMAEAFLSDLEEDSTSIAPARSYGEIQSVLDSGRIAAVLSIEGAEGLGTDVELWRTMYRLGVRVAALTWNRRTGFADGIGERGSRGGLTSQGFASIKEMNRLNMLIDVSHLAERGFFDVMETSTQTVIATHSNARAVCDHPRNLTDEQIKALAANGGVMGLLLHPGMIGPENPTVSHAVDHIAYVADLVGIDHIGLGADYSDEFLADFPASGQECIMPMEMLRAQVKGCGKIEEIPNLTVEMVRRGFSEADIRKVMGENMLRVFEKVLADKPA